MAVRALIPPNVFLPLSQLQCSIGDMVRTDVGDRGQGVNGMDIESSEASPKDHDQFTDQ